MHNILHIIDNLNTVSGGTSLEVALLANRQAATLDYSVTIATRITSESSFIPTLDERISLLPLPTLNEPSDFVFRSTKLLNHIIESDIIFVTGVWGLYDGLLTSFIIRFLNQDDKIVIRVCGMLEPYILARRWYKKTIALCCYVRLNLCRCNALIVNSIPERDHVLQFSPRNTLVIKNGISLPSCSRVDRKSARSFFTIDESHILFLYIGRLHPKKGLHLFLSAIASAFSSLNSPKSHSFSVLVAGSFSDQNYQRHILKLVNNVKTYCNVSLLGNVAGDAKRNLLLASDIFFLPSYSEGMPNALLEALSYGLPVLATPGCNLPEIETNDMGFIAEPQVNDLMKSILLVLELKREGLAPIGKRARDYAAIELSPTQTDLAYSDLVRAVVSP
jgi:poly(glycerol-phosphate) alpha-glucosyltransferase